MRAPSSEDELNVIELMPPILAETPAAPSELNSENVSASISEPDSGQESQEQERLKKEIAIRFEYYAREALKELIVRKRKEGHWIEKETIITNKSLAELKKEFSKKQVEKKLQEEFAKGKESFKVWLEESFKEWLEENYFSKVREAIKEGKIAREEEQNNADVTVESKKIHSALYSVHFAWHLIVCLSLAATSILFTASILPVFGTIILGLTTFVLSHAKFGNDVLEVVDKLLKGRFFEDYDNKDQKSVSKIAGVCVLFGVVSLANVFFFLAQLTKMVQLSTLLFSLLGMTAPLAPFVLGVVLAATITIFMTFFMFKACKGFVDKLSGVADFFKKGWFLPEGSEENIHWHRIKFFFKSLLFYTFVIAVTGIASFFTIQSQALMALSILPAYLVWPSIVAAVCVVSTLDLEDFMSKTNLFLGRCWNVITHPFESFKTNISFAWRGVKFILYDGPASVVSSITDGMYWMTMIFKGAPQVGWNVSYMEMQNERHRDAFVRRKPLYWRLWEYTKNIFAGEGVISSWGKMKEKEQDKINTSRLEYYQSQEETNQTLLNIAVLSKTSGNLSGEVTPSESASALVWGGAKLSNGKGEPEARVKKRWNGLKEFKRQAELLAESLTRFLDPRHGDRDTASQFLLSQENRIVRPDESNRPR